MKASITYKPDSQKIKGAIKASLTAAVLKDICQKVTGQKDYSVVEDSSSYNKGRLVIIDYEGHRFYVTLSEKKLEGRNSSIQSVPTALNIFCRDTYSDKQLCYYFLEHTGKAFTNYHMFMYRLMATAGMQFINVSKYTDKAIVPFHNIDDLIYTKKLLRLSNKSNNSSYVTKSPAGIQIYAKVYGASKYESTLLAFAASKISFGPIDLFNVCERDLQRLPLSSRNTLENLNIRFHDTNLFFDIKHQNEAHTDDLRSSAYIYNLLKRIGDKQCALCGCPVQEIVQGAHIWSVADIRKSNLSEDEKFKAATSGDNGLWLCQNHHKLFDTNLIMIDQTGSLKVSSNLDDDDARFIKSITPKTHLRKNTISREFAQYLKLRNSSIDTSNSIALKSCP